jgi:hypothetical protein
MEAISNEPDETARVAAPSLDSLPDVAALSASIWGRSEVFSGVEIAL